MTTRAATARDVLSWLERRGTRRNREGMARYGIVAPKVFGVSVSTLQQLAKRLGRSHDLAAALWETGWYEARMLTAFVDDPARVTATQMDRWVRDFDNWAICDTVCFHLFDRTVHAWRKVGQWSRRRDEFVRRAAFALLAGLALHDKGARDEPFLRSLVLVERAAFDDRNFVKKGVSWALRGVGRRNRALHAAAVTVAERLARSPAAAARWVGRDALRDLASPAGAATARDTPTRIMIGEASMQKITTFLTFNDRAEEAVNLYTSVFKNSRIVKTTRYGNGGPGPQGALMSAVFELEGQQFIALNGGPTFQFAEGVSLFVNCETQAEIDDLWEKLSAGGAPGRCGWLKDRFGLSWQVIPTVLGEMLNDKDAARAQRVMQAMLQMTKLDIGGLKRAYEQR